MKSLIYLSLGAGVQSSALYVLCAQGRAPRADVAIFADTQDEPGYVYEQLDRLETWGKKNGGCRIDRVKRGSLSLSQAQLTTTRSFLPMFVDNDGKRGFLRRKCTSEFKINVIERHVRKLLGFGKGERIKDSLATALIGISRDEAIRMKESRVAWIENTYPLVDLNIRRAECLRIVEAAGLPTPLKSACVYCPFKDTASWMWLKKEHPDEFEKACAVDDKIRDSSHAGIKLRAYLHSSLKPLREVDLEDRQADLFDGFGNECNGVCGV